MEGPALKWTLSEVQLLRLRATFHTLRYFTNPRKFYTRKHEKIKKKLEIHLKADQTQSSDQLNISAPPHPPPFHLPLEKGNRVCDVISSSNVASNANEQEQKKTSK